MPTITIKRKTAAVYAMTPFKVYVDGRKISVLENGAEISVDVSAGNHEVGVKAGLFGKIAEVSFLVSAGESKTIVAEPFKQGSFRSVVKISEKL